MKKILLFIMIYFTLFSNMSAQWKPAGNKIKTEWSDKIDVNNVLPEYPRPIMKRSQWKNLNGLWNYAILPVGSHLPAKFDGKILVPFAIESSLSGVQKEVGKDNELWYNREFIVPKDWKGKEIMLNFGAVDWKADVFLNGKKVGSHTGGFTPFSFNITPYLKAGIQKLDICVWDPTTEGYQPVGKQNTNPEGIWYTPVTGIWQTVWIEPVNKKHIMSMKAIPDINDKSVTIDIDAVNINKSDIIEAFIKEDGKIIAKTKKRAGEPLKLEIPNPKLWSPENPYLYNLSVNLYTKGKLQDEIQSYIALRKISSQKDKNGIVRMQLNDKDYFQFGPLDQGWWPDGLYTAPTDEALVSDIKLAKDLGFNMIRKHVKVEPARWYTHCDSLGILVWQDMPNGDKSPQWQNREYFNGEEVQRSPESKENFNKEWKEIIDNLISYPSIAVWVPFNEAWGQFDTEKVSDWTKNYDPSRLVNSASGGNFYHTGDILDLHNYPSPEMYLYDPERVNVLGEYGGIGLPMEGHLWQPEKNWGYVQFKNPKEVTDEYVKYGEILIDLIPKGFSAAVYTQTSDVEGEVNGFITYDRKKIKVDTDRVKKINTEICNSLSK